MILVRNTVISDDIKDHFFTCNIEKCKGACCVEGDLGAPLEDDELPLMKEIQENVAPYLTEAGRKEIERQGPYILDEEGDYSTPTIHGKECAYAVRDEKGHLQCGIEKAYLDGKIEFRKPVSCHLYPIRITKYEDYDAINYDRWQICAPACELGKTLGMPLYRFCKDALIRKYGQEWYDELEEEVGGSENKNER
jgi:hypothetical protein